MKAARCWTGHPSPPLIVVPFKSPSRVEVMESLLCLFEPCGSAYVLWGGRVVVVCGAVCIVGFSIGRMDALSSEVGVRR